MYMILVWELGGNYLTCIKNADKSIRLFEYEEAQKYLDRNAMQADYRIIGITEALNPNT